MAQVTATIASKVGLHARPAATFVKAVAEKGVPVTIAKEGGAPVDASSILGVMTLGGIASFLQLSRSFVMPISQVTQQISSISMAMAGATRIFSLLDAES